MSLLNVMENGASAEIAVVGYEGIVGIALFMGGVSTPSRAVVQSAGMAYRLTAAQMMEEFNQTGPVQHLLLRYTQALITQMAQTAVCNRHHSLDQQLCRWLLLSLDRLSSSELVMTQELIANMLGVRREGVTAAAGRLHRSGLIQYRRGHITVLDRAGLRRAPASATRSSRPNMIACSHQRPRPSVAHSWRYGASGECRPPDRVFLRLDARHRSLRPEDFLARGARVRCGRDR